MAQRKAHRRAASRQEIPRILPAEAARILHEIEQVLDKCQALLADLSSVGIVELLRRLDDRMVQLAIQPDDSGERTRARLMSADPAAPDAQFRVSLRASSPHILSAQQVVDLVATVGEELVGVCYFGDVSNKKRVEESLSASQRRFPKHPA